MEERSITTQHDPSSHHSCALCRQRKVKCDKQNPCSYCIRHRTPCVPALPTVSRPRKKRFPEAELLSRLRKYESALREYGADIEAILNDESPLERKYGNNIRAESLSSTSDSALGLRKHSKNLQHFHVANDEIEPVISDGKCPIFRVSPEDKLEHDLVFLAYNDDFEGGVGPLMANQNSTSGIHDFHPVPVQILHLWQVFLDNIHPLLKAFHAPTMQKKVLKAAFDLRSSTPAMHAFLLAIYANSVTSMSDEECMDSMDERRSSLITRFTMGARHALQQASFLASTDVLVVQAYVLYLYAIMYTVHPRSLVRLTGLAERTGRILGLHRTSQAQGTSALDAEMNRRVWWQIALLDLRAAELSASGTSMLSSDWHVPLPVNVNEADFRTGTETVPENSQGLTDMVFCLVRCEVAEFMRQLRQNNTMFKWNEFSSLSEPLNDKLTTILRFERYLHSNYLNQCDPAIPIHIFTHYYALYSISKMRIVAYRTLAHPDRPLTSTAMTKRQDMLLLTCIEVIEAYNRCAENRLLKDFTWFSASCFPFLAYVHLLCGLHGRTEGELATRAWDSLLAWNGRPGWLSALNMSANNKFDDTIQLAFAKLSIAAWDTRVREKTAEEPEFIVHMRGVVASQPSGSTAGIIRRPQVSQDFHDGDHKQPTSYPSLHYTQSRNRDSESMVADTTALDFSDMFMSHDPLLGEDDWQALLSFEPTWN